MKRLLCLISVFLFAQDAFTNQAPKVQRWHTAQGTPVVFYQAMEVPMVDVTVAFAAGSAYDHSQFGISALTAELLNQGNGGLTAGQLAEKIAETGAQYNANVTRDMSLYNLRTLSEPNAYKAAVALFQTILNEPDFPQQAFSREKNQQLMAITQGQEDPNEHANRLFFGKLYGKHPYAHPIIGVKDSVKQIQRKDVQTFYQTYFTQKNATIVIVGAMNKANARTLADTLLKKRPKGHTPPPIPKAHAAAQGQVFHTKFPSSQTAVRLGQLSITHHSDAFFPLQVGNYILGGGALVSRLSNEVREKRGLTYGITSQFVPMPAGGPYVISLSTVGNQTHRALKVVKKTLKDYLDKGPTKNELIAAKQYMTGSFPLSLISNRSIAEMLLKISFYKLPENYLETYVDKINHVSQAEIKAAFQTHIHPEAMIQVTVGQ